jgi:hypothetical protein
MTVVLTVLGVIGSLVGIYGVYWAVVRERMKLFAYEVSRGLAVASTSRIGGDYQLSVHFKSKGGQEEKVEGAYLQFVRFANLGREAIRSEDNAPANPIRLVVSGARVLDIALVDQNREVNRVTLSAPKLLDSGGEANVSFDYLDHGDGALVRVLTAGEAKKIEIQGDVIDMPGGIVCTSPKESGDTAIRIAAFLFVVAEIFFFGLTGWVFYKATGTWSNLWLVPLPLLAFVIPLFGLFVLDESSSKFRRAYWRRRTYPELTFPGNFPFGQWIFDPSFRRSDMRAELERPKPED